MIFLAIFNIIRLILMSPYTCDYPDEITASSGKSHPYHWPTFSIQDIVSIFILQWCQPFVQSFPSHYPVLIGLPPGAEALFLEYFYGGFTGTLILLLASSISHHILTLF